MMMMIHIYYCVLVTYIIIIPLSIRTAGHVTYYLSGISCEETILNSAFTLEGDTEECTMVQGGDHVTVECTGKKGEAVVTFWGILK